MHLNIGELDLKSGLTGDEEIEIDEDEDDEIDEDEDYKNQNNFQETYEQRKLDGQKLKRDFEGSRQLKIISSDEALINTETNHYTNKVESRLLDLKMDLAAVTPMGDIPNDDHPNVLGTTKTHNFLPMVDI